MAEAATLNILTHPILANAILPFLLIFTVIFAILERTKLLGDEKKSANLIIALVIGFIFISVQTAVGFTLRFIPIISVFIIVLLCIFLIFGFIDIHKNKGVQITLGVVFGIALLVSILWATGLLAKMTASPPNADVIGIIILFIVIAGVIGLLASSKTTPETKTT